MEFTFGICAAKNNKNMHQIVIDSIQCLNIPKYEILFVDNECEPPNGINIKHLTYSDSLDKPGWITKKKNLIAQHAKYENIVFLHDYISFQPHWYEGFKQFNDDFDVCMNIILNLDGTRFRDWCLNPFQVIPPNGPITNREFMIPYNETRLISKMYISGAYWVAKKQFMLDNPLNEDKVWGESEDIEWSEKIMTKADYKMNTKSTVSLMKQKHFDFSNATNETIQKLL